MAINAKFQADFSSFLQAIDKAELALVDFGKGAGKVESSLNRMVDNFSGRKLIQEASLMTIAVEKAGGVAKLTAQEIERVGSKANDAADKLKRLGYEVPAGLQKLANETKNAAAASADLGVSSASLAKELISVAAGFISIGKAVSVLTDVVAFASHLDDLSKSSNLSTDALQELGFAGRRVGLDLDSIAGLVDQLAKRVGTNQAGAVGAIQSLGLSLSDLKSQSPDQLFTSVATAVGRIENPIQQAAIGSELFGKQFSAALRLVNDGLPQTRAEAQRLGIVIDSELIKKTDEFGDHVGDLTLKWKAVAAEGLSPLLPLLDELAQKTILWLQHLKDGKFPDSRFGIPTGIGIRGVNPLLDAMEDARPPSFPLGGNNARIGASAPGSALPAPPAPAGSTTVGDVGPKISDVDLIANRLKALRTAALEPLTAAQRAQIASLQEWGENEKDIAMLVKASQEAVHKYIASLQEQKSETKKNNEAWKEYMSVGNAVTGVYGQLSAAQIEGIQFDIKRGISLENLARVYGVTKEQVSALADALKVLAEVRKIEAGTSPEALSSGLNPSKFGELGFIEQELRRFELLRRVFDLEHENKPLGDLGLISSPDRNSSIEHMGDLAKSVDTLTGAFAQLAQVSGGTFGGIVKDIAGVIAAMNLLNKGVALVQEGTVEVDRARLAGQSTSSGRLQQAAGLATQAASFVSVTGSGSTASRALGGLLTGAQIGKELGGPIGEAIGASIGFITGIARGLHQSEAQRLAHDIGRDLGVQISDGLAQQLEADSKRIGRQATESLHLDQIIGEAAGGVKGFGVDLAISKARDLFSFLQTGKLTAQEVGDEFDKVFSIILPEAIDKTTGLASEAFTELIQQARAAGQLTPAVKAFTGAQVTDNILAGLDAFLKIGNDAADAQRTLISLQRQLASAQESGNTKRIAQIQKEIDTVKKQQELVKAALVSSKDSAAALGGALFVAFEQLRENGASVTAALKQIQPTFDALEKSLKKTGFAGGAAFDALKPFFDIIKDPVVGPAIDAVDALAKVLAGLNNIGRLDPSIIAGLGNQIGGIIDKLTKSGKSPDDIIKLEQPALQQLFELQERTGAKFDDITQAIIDKAVKDGLVGDQFKSAQERTVTGILRTNFLLESIATKLGAVFLPPLPRPSPGQGPGVPVPLPGGGGDNPLPLAMGGIVPQYLATGGKLLSFTPRGSDTVPIMGTPGEGMVNLRGMSLLGVNGLSALNSGQVPSLLSSSGRSMYTPDRPLPSGSHASTPPVVHQHFDFSGASFLDQEVPKKLLRAFREELSKGGPEQTRFRHAVQPNRAA